MPKKISFKNNQGTDIIKFDNIKLMFDDDLKRVVFDLYIDFEFFKAQTSLDAEEFDFLNMKKCLQKIYNKEWKSFVAFNPLEERFIMQIDLQGDGQIKVHSKLINPMFTGKLEFDFIMDHTTIPGLIREIEAALEV
jgi:hypothetical protein